MARLHIITLGGLALERDGRSDIHARKVGGNVLLDGARLGAHWHNLTSIRIQLTRWADVTEADQVRICIGQRLNPVYLPIVEKGSKARSLTLPVEVHS